MCDPGVSFKAVKNRQSNVIDSSMNLRTAIEISGRTASLDDAESLWHEYSDKGITEEVFIKILENFPSLSKGDFFAAIHELVVVPSAEVDAVISVTELREILSTGPNALSEDEIDDLLALQPNRDHFNLDQFWLEYKDTLVKCSHVRPEDIGNLNNPTSANAVASVFLDKKNRYQHTTKGCLIYEDPDLICGHQFTFDLTTDTDITILIQPASLPIMIPDIDPNLNDLDLDIFLIREIDKHVHHRRLTGFCNNVDRQRRFGFQQKIAKGRYILLPFTTGAWFRDNREAVRETTGTHKPVLSARGSQDLFTRNGGITELSHGYTNALHGLFDMVDLDGNGSIDRREFEIFARRTTGDSVQDDDWKVVTASFPTQNGQLNKAGFMQLHKMEAGDTGPGNVRDLWITLDSMGFDENLSLKRVLLYNLYVGSSACDFTLLPMEIRPVNPVVDKCIIRAASERGDAEFLEADITLHKISNGSRFSLVLQNTGHQEQIVECELKEAENCISSHEFPRQVRLSAKKAAVMAHFVPKDTTLPWKINTTELVK